jgi:hypothetical protein
MGAAIVLHASLLVLPPRPAWHEPLLQSLPYARRLQLTSRTEAERRASLAALALALLAAEQISGRPFAPRAFQWSPAGRPQLLDGPRFSLSHCATRVACCVTAATRCGIDIEDLPAAADATTQRKLWRWTATEATLKAMGLGLRAANEVVVDEAIDWGTVRGSRFALQALTELPGVVGHIAASSRCGFSLAEINLCDDATVSAALQRSLGLAAQFE